MANANSLQNRTSRYVHGGRTEIGNDRLEWWDKFNFPADSSDSTYIVENFYSGRPDLIASVFYDDPLLWWVIAQYNNILDPIAEMVTGRVLLIPTKSRLDQFLVGKTGGYPSTREEIKTLKQLIV